MRLVKYLAWSIVVLWMPAFAENWPQWRGPYLNGVSKEENLPVRWSTTENIAWKLAMPSKTGSTPIIWGNSIFLNVAEGDSLYLWCVDKAKGAPIWKKLISQRQLRDQQAEHVVAFARHGRQERVRADGNRRAEGFRLRRQRTVGARHSEGLRQVRLELGIWLLAAAL